MSIFEYDKEEEDKKLRKEEFDLGEETGMRKGEKKAINRKKSIAFLMCAPGGARF